MYILGDIDGRIVAVFRSGHITRMLSAGNLDLDLGRGDCHNAANNGLIGTRINIFLKHVGKAGGFGRRCGFLLFNDFCLALRKILRHGFQYLLNYTVGRGCTRSNADRSVPGQVDLVQFPGSLDQKGRAV